MSTAIVLSNLMTTIGTKLGLDPIMGMSLATILVSLDTTTIPNLANQVLEFDYYGMLLKVVWCRWTYLVICVGVVGWWWRRTVVSRASSIIIYDINTMKMLVRYMENYPDLFKNISLEEWSKLYVPSTNAPDMSGVSLAPGHSMEFADTNFNVRGHIVVDLQQIAKKEETQYFKRLRLVLDKSSKMSAHIYVMAIQVKLDEMTKPYVYDHALPALFKGRSGIHLHPEHLLQRAQAQPERIL